MTRRPCLLTFTLAAAAAAIVLCWYVAEPAPPDPLTWDEASEPIPETYQLRVVAKRQIAREVAAGRWQLLEAASLFRALDRQPPATYPPYRRDLPWRTEEEWYCRNVILFVANLENNRPGAAVAAARLEDELRGEMDRDGGVRLPDPAGLPTPFELLERARAWMAEERRAITPARRGDPPAIPTPAAMTHIE
jgi:hypothetical protein